MNNDRRKELTALVERIETEVLEPLRAAKDALENLRGDIEGVKDDEQDYFDNMPENFQQADKGQMAEAAVGELDEAIVRLEDAVDNLNNAGA